MKSDKNLGSKRAENSQGNFFKCSMGCDVRKKNHLTRVIKTIRYLGVRAVRFGRGVFFYPTGPKISQNQGKKRVLFGNQVLIVRRCGTYGGNNVNVDRSVYLCL